jgi:hypothetical protein
MNVIVDNFCAFYEFKHSERMSLVSTTQVDANMTHVVLQSPVRQLHLFLQNNLCALEKRAPPNSFILYDKRTTAAGTFVRCAPKHACRARQTTRYDKLCPAEAAEMKRMGGLPKIFANDPAIFLDVEVGVGDVLRFERANEPAYYREVVNCTSGK